MSLYVSTNQSAAASLNMRGFWRAPIPGEAPMK